MKNQMKDLIADAFVALAKKKSVDKITVKDLVDYCDISRQSFYYHFQDILEVLEYLSQRMERDIAARSREASSLEEAVKLLTGHFIESFPLIEKMRDSQKRDFVEQLVLDSLQNHFRAAVKEAAANRPLGIAGADIEALINFCSYGLAGLMVAHCKTKSPNVDELTRQIIAVFKYLIPAPDGER